MRKTWPVGLGVFVLDRASKLAAQSLLATLPEGSVALVPGVIHLTYAQNTGIAFSMLPLPPWMLALLTLLVLGLAALMIRRWAPRGAWSDALLWALLAGGLGNCADRLLYGYVIDFIELRFVRFAIFNAADIAITCSCAGLALLMLLEGEGHAKDTREG